MALDHKFQKVLMSFKATKYPCKRYFAVYNVIQDDNSTVAEQFCDPT